MPSAGKMRSKSQKFGRRWENSTRFGPRFARNRTNLARWRPTLVRVRPIDQLWPDSGQICLNTAGVDPTWPGIGEHGPGLGRVGPETMNFDQSLVRTRPDTIKLGQKVAQPTPGQFAPPTSANFGHFLAKSGSAVSGGAGGTDSRPDPSAVRPLSGQMLGHPPSEFGPLSDPDDRPSIALSRA